MLKILILAAGFMTWGASGSSAWAHCSKECKTECEGAAGKGPSCDKGCEHAKGDSCGHGKSPEKCDDARCKHDHAEKK